MYAATEIKGDEIVRVKDPNLIVALMGKIAGMQIHKTTLTTNSHPLGQLPDESLR